MAVLVLVKGAGDLATGVAHRLYRSGFRVLMTELAQPTVVRRTVSFAEAIYEGRQEVEGVVCRLASGLEEARAVLERGEIPALIDPAAEIALQLRPQVVVDAIMAKRNCGTRITDAPVVIGLGPGFTAGSDVHAVVETNRGHDLGRVILQGAAEPDTGIPAPISGFAAERLVRSPADGVFASQPGDRRPGAGGGCGRLRGRLSCAGPDRRRAAGADPGRRPFVPGTEDGRRRPARPGGVLLHHLRQGAGGWRRGAGGRAVLLERVPACGHG